jgi:UDP-N-acetylglucosamine acyltransferase
MTAIVHPLAQVHPDAILGRGVRVEAFAVVGAGVELGDETVVGAGAVVEGPTRIGRGNQIFSHACIGFPPQDLSYAGEPTRLEIGDRNSMREFCTIHRGTAKGGGVTRIGNDNLLMAYIHIAHDCQIGNRVVMANNATLAGHVEIHDDASVSAFCAVHQFSRIGRHAYLGALTRLSLDAPPFIKVAGQRVVCYGINAIGMRRKGYSAAQVAKLAKAVRLLIRSGLNTAQAVARMRAELEADPDLDYFISFLESSRRGVHKAMPRSAKAGESDGDADGEPNGD